MYGALTRDGGVQTRLPAGWETSEYDDFETDNESYDSARFYLERPPPISCPSCYESISNNPSYARFMFKLTL